MLISIVKDYSSTPSGRFYSDGDYSGQDFRERLLKPKFLEAKSRGEVLTVDLDGCYGYGSSFLEEAFGGLVRELHDKSIKNIKIISNDEPQLVDRIKEYIADELENGGENNES